MNWPYRNWSIFNNPFSFLGQCQVTWLSTELGPWNQRRSLGPRGILRWKHESPVCELPFPGYWASTACMYFDYIVVIFHVGVPSYLKCWVHGCDRSMWSTLQSFANVSQREMLSLWRNINPKRVKIECGELRTFVFTGFHVITKVQGDRLCWI